MLHANYAWVPTVSRPSQLCPFKITKRIAVQHTFEKNDSLLATSALAGSSMSLSSSNSRKLFSKEPYSPPSWVQSLGVKPPAQRMVLGQLPTPIHQIQVPELPSGAELWVKRDDLSGMQLSGNKVRKLEFLMADAKEQGCDCVITIGGIQSNHCRATACAARYLGMDSYLILRVGAEEVEKDPGLDGNLLVERMVGAHLEMVTTQEYVALGSETLGQSLKARLEKQGRKPYLIPVGGSNSLGSWGYVDAYAEIEKQMEEGNDMEFVDDIVLACGSGGTAAGLALGCRLSGSSTKVHAYGVCDSPSYFYQFIDKILQGMGCDQSSKDMVRCVQAKGYGYAISHSDELEFMQHIALSTGIVLDPVYSGKALYHLFQEMKANPKAWEGRKVLFVHTGGLLGMYSKASQLQPIVSRGSQVTRFPFDDIVEDNVETW
eukprot:CAMPEP_0114251124 /NCGR_PEP_ID=MMETSP0058-20121206/15096_1 /TAXON_ID=36894 /ORGANISM="Pyramimonas parkeae, CCMP726" /LENGTH=431 /DNA_ID=CAMNT_0001364891 /DNA_START=225 /DNA_END=1517 /DNA_ORIENTATION=-